MTIVKLFTRANIKTAKFVKANTLQDLKEQTIAKFGFEANRFAMKSDGSEIDDEDVFAEILKDYPKDLELVALREDEEYEASKSSGISSLQGPVQNESVSPKPATDLMRDWNERKQRVNALMKIEDTDGFDQTNEKKDELQTVDKIRLLKERRDLLQNADIETKMSARTELENLELEVARIELRNHQIAKLFHEFKMAEKVDFCYMVDCTLSMDVYINEAKSVIDKITKVLTKRYESLELRFAFVGYRDHDFGDDRITVFPFSQNVDDFKRFVGNVFTKGGYDACEDVFGGLEEVSKLDWKHMSRLLLHIGDSPCHGSRFHFGLSDDYLGGDPRGLKIENLMKSLIDKNIKYYFAQINDSTAKMIDEFNEEIAKLDGSPIKVVNLKAADGLTRAVSLGITATIEETQRTSRSLAQGKALKNKKPNKKLSWDNAGFTKHEITLYKPIYNFNIKDIPTTKISYSTVETTIYMAPQPFSQGALRFAQAAYLVDPETGAKKRCVVKESKFSEPKFNTIDYIKESIECQVISIFLAREFEKVSPSKKSLKFVDISFIKVKDTGAFYSLEEYLDGKFFKMSNNAGFVNEESYSATLDAFMHWSYVFTDQYLVVTDLQGIRAGNSYILTDPAITCPNSLLRFSITNLGRKGLQKVFKTHKCNHMCERLQLLNQAYQESFDVREMTSSMTQMNN